VVQLVDGSRGAALNALSRTLFLALDRRDRAIEDIRLLAPPAPHSEDIARVRARKSQEEDEVVTFETVIPNTIAQFDDEPDDRRHAHRRDGPDGRRAPAPQPRGRSGDGNQGQGQPCGR